MKAYDFDAVVYNPGGYATDYPGQPAMILCVECLPRGVNAEDFDVYPIFANAEWDYAPTCDKCGRVHDYMTILQPAY